MEWDGFTISFLTKRMRELSDGDIDDLNKEWKEIVRDGITVWGSDPALSNLPLSTAAGLIDPITGKVLEADNYFKRGDIRIRFNKGTYILRKYPLRIIAKYGV